jgi:CRISPR-associated endonuclease/helicase Cas3
VSAFDLSPDDFVPFFRAVHGVDPFPWQERLLRQVTTDGIWPDVLDLPTGSGKTAALDLAVFHLALEAGRENGRCAPLRIAFVVDRRLIVDDAYTRACKLADALTNPNNPIVCRVAAALQRFVGENQRPLAARRLRGGMPREDDWARTPVQPTILCSTVDQVGSRLLFRGYGISDRMKPVHAGLFGSDCLILLDEAHLSKPFRQTLAAIEKLRKPDGAPWGVAFLTATPEQPAQRCFRLDDDDRAHPILARRLRAAKSARLVEIPDRQGIDAEVRRVEAIADETKTALAVLKKSGIPNPAIGIVVNRVMRARRVFERLRGELTDAEVTLVVGPTRAIDREDRVHELARIRTDAPRTLDKPLIVIATQTIEAGVDIDLDGLVTEVAALDALRQRFGRLNRAGRPVSAFAAIMAHKDDIDVKASDPVYANRAAETWKELQRLAAASPEGMVDFSVETFGSLLSPKQIAELAAPTMDAPVLLPPYADLWSQTSPLPAADPEVALFLHGPDRSPASIQIVWRADIGEQDLRPAERERLIDLLKLVPPRSAETIAMPIWAVQAWLREQYEPLQDLADAAGRASDDLDRTQGRRVFRYAGPDDRKTRPIFAGEIRPGDLIVVPAEYGGCDEWGWNPQSGRLVKDGAEVAAQHYRARRFAVRITPELILQELLSEEGIGPLPGPDVIRDRLGTVLADNRDASATEILGALLALDALPVRLRNWLEELRKYKRRLDPWFVYGYDAEEKPRGVVIVAPFGLKKSVDAEDAAPPATESDDLGSASGYPQSLDEHSEEVKNWAASFAGRAGLSEETAADVALAAYLHDAGKADPRFQAYLSGGDPFGWDERKVLAKSGRPSLSRNARERAGLPLNWRHEALSVRLAQLHLRFSKANDPALVLWLIGTHHGFGRPLFPHADPLDGQPRDDLPQALGMMHWQLTPGFGPQSLAFEFNGRDWAQIFGDLKQRYGIWGLARLEAFVRLADHRASETAARQYAEQPSEETLP